jgi:hypothetical protein
MPRLRRPLTAIVVTGAAMFMAAPAGAPAAATAPDDAPAKLSVNTQVKKFRVVHGRTSASARVTARLTDANGQTTAISKNVTLSAARKGSCRILKLTLDDLQLNLLGLHADLDQVKLDVTGSSRGGVLGRLFCKLARSKVSAAGRKAAARTLNARLRRHPMRFVGFTATVPPARQSQATANRCPVLDLVVGPLDLDLLGLKVKLSKVHLNVFAIRGEGAVGDRFCGLSSTA